jgi:hypothetical protein
VEQSFNSGQTLTDLEEWRPIPLASRAAAADSDPAVVIGGFDREKSDGVPADWAKEEKFSVSRRPRSRRLEGGGVRSCSSRWIGGLRLLEGWGRLQEVGLRRGGTRCGGAPSEG